MEETGGALTMEGNASRDAKGISVREWRQKTSILPRKRLSDISNLSVNEIGNGLVADIQKNVKTGSPVMVNEYIAKILKENNVLMSALAERNLEVQNLRLMVAKINQQNWQFAQAHSQMLAEVNLAKDRLKVAQLEAKCSSAALKVKTQELEVKNFNKKNKRIESITTLGTAEQTVGNIVDASQLPSSKKTCLSNRKRPKRSQSLGPGGVSITNQAATEEMEENRRKPLRRLINLKVETCVPSGDLFEVEDAKFPIFQRDNRELKDGAISCQQEPASSVIRIKEEQEDQFASSLGRTSLGGRPLRRAAARVNSYKEMAINTKLRR